MARLRLKLSLSLDGFVAGPGQSVRDPLGIGGMRLHEWAFPLAAWRALHGLEGGEVNASSRVVEESVAGVGATLMGRNMFGGHPGPWDGRQPWNGWWGDDPPFHHPVFVVTHHARAPLHLQGGTTFTFVTDGIEAALAQARRAAAGRDVSLAGGASIARQYLGAGLVDETELHLVPARCAASVCSKGRATICTGSNWCAPSPRRTSRICGSPGADGVRWRAVGDCRTIPASAPSARAGPRAGGSAPADDRPTGSRRTTSADNDWRIISAGPTGDGAKAMKLGQRVTPCLWFDDQAEAAARFYTGIFDDSGIDTVTRYGEAGFEIHGRPAGSVMTVSFRLAGLQITALNGGPHFRFSEAVSLEVECADQREIDYYWRALSEGGDPAAQQCGWLKDKFGLSWQVVPKALRTCSPVGTRAGPSGP